MTGQVSSRFYQAKDYAKALADKEATGGIMRRCEHPSLGVGYEVMYPPSPLLISKEGLRACQHCGEPNRADAETCWSCKESLFTLPKGWLLGD